MDEKPIDEVELPDALEGKRIGTVSQLNTHISKVINATTHEFDYIIGDVTGANSSGNHYYFNIQDGDNEIQCIIFNHNRFNTPDFGEGDRVAVSGDLNFYEKNGSMSFIIDNVYLVGDSLYHKKIAELAAELEEKGVFDEEEKQELPLIPTTVGVVTARDSDAEQDTIDSIKDRFPDTSILLYDVNVQGDKAKEDIIGGIATLEKHDSVDVIVVTRGGGRESALHAFNTEGVCRIAHNVETPVVSAIGHENDNPLLDRAADARAMTPTNVGETVVLDKSEWMSTIESHENRLTVGYGRVVEEKLVSFDETVTSTYELFVTTEIDTLSRGVEDSYMSIKSERLQTLSHALSESYNHYVSTHVTALRNDVSQSFESFKQSVEHERETAGLRKREKRYKRIAIALIILLGLAAVSLFIWLVIL